jgi:hemerythrin-like domain-containing protein
MGHGLDESGNLRDRMLADHRKLEGLLEDVVAACEEDDREAFAQAWTRLEALLLNHLRVEERLLIPVLGRMDGISARSILAEHQHIRARLLEIGANVDLHCVRAGTVRACANELRAHAQTEDRLLYAWANQNLEESKRAEVLTSLVAGV